MSPGVEIVVGISATGVGGYLTYVLRRIDNSLDRQEQHERALFGDDQLDWPGVVDLATENRTLLTDGGEDQEGAE